MGMYIQGGILIRIFAVLLEVIPKMAVYVAILTIFHIGISNSLVGMAIQHGIEVFQYWKNSEIKLVWFSPSHEGYHQRVHVSPRWARLNECPDLFEGMVGVVLP